MSCLKARECALELTPELRRRDDSLDDLSLVLEPNLLHVLLPKVFRLMGRRPAQMPALDLGSVLVKRAASTKNERT